jgi:hypothetical protein
MRRHALGVDRRVWLRRRMLMCGAGLDIGRSRRHLPLLQRERGRGG